MAASPETFVVDPEIFDLAISSVKKVITGEILNIYAWGSRVFNNHTTNSDWDFMVIVTGMPTQIELF